MAEDPQLIGGSDFAFQIFQIDPAHLGQLLRQMPELAFLHKLAGGKDGFDLCGGNGAAQPLHPGRVVHHCRDASPGDSTEYHGRRDACVRQHQANFFALGAVFIQDARHKQRFGQQLAVGIGLEIDILDAVLARAVAVLRRQQGFEQRFPRAHGHARFHHNLMQHLARQPAAIAGAWRFRHRQLRRRQDMQSNTWEKALLHQPLQAAEEGQLRAFDAHRDHRCARFSSHKGRPVINLHQRAGDGDTSLGEDHHRPAALDQSHQLLDRHRFGGIEGDKVDQVRQGAHVPALAN